MMGRSYQEVCAMIPRRFIASMLALSLVLLPTLGTARAAPKVTLTVWLPDFTTPATQTWFKSKLLPAFSKAYPQISVKMVYVNWNVYDQKVTTAFAGGDAPDVLQTGAEYVPSLVAKNMIRPIDAYLSSWGHKQDFYPGAWQNTVWQGRNYGVPYISGVRALVYRKSLLKAAGITHPPTTWDELYRDAVKLTQHAKGKLVRLGFNTYGSAPGDYWQQWLPYFEEAG